MYKAIVCDIQGVLIKNNEINNTLVDFLINNKEFYKSLILYTNLSKQSVQKLRSELSSLFNCVDKVYTYNDVEYPKPDLEGFKQILDEWNLEPNEVIFIDDSIVNIASAKTLGLEVLHYEHFNNVSELEKLLL